MCLNVLIKWAIAQALLHGVTHTKFYTENEMYVSILNSHTDIVLQNSWLLLRRPEQTQSSVGSL